MEYLFFCAQSVLIVVFSSIILNVPSPELFTALWE